MTEQPNTDAREAELSGERPDLGRTEDQLKVALTGTPEGSFTRAGSPAGGSASGSERAPTQGAINESLTSEGTQPADGSVDAPHVDATPGEVVNNTGADLTGPDGDPAEGKRDAGPRDVDAATG